MYRFEFVVNPSTGRSNGPYRVNAFYADRQCVVYKGYGPVAVVADADIAQKIVDALNKADAS